MQSKSKMADYNKGVKKKKFSPSDEYKETKSKRNRGGKKKTKKQKKQRMQVHVSGVNQGVHAINIWRGKERKRSKIFVTTRILH